MPERFGRTIIIGDACVDVTIPLQEIVGNMNTGSSSDKRFQPTITGGGTSANTAVALSKLGVPTAFMGTLGADFGGRFLREEFKNWDIDATLTLTDDASNTVYVFAFIDGQGERSLWAFPRTDVSYINYDLSKVDLDLVRTANWVHASGMTFMFDGNIRKRVPEIFKAAFEAGVPTSFDLNTRVRDQESLDEGVREAVLQTLPYVRFLLGSGKDEFYSFCPCADWRDSVRSFAVGGRVAIARMGGEGSFAVGEGFEDTQRPFDVPVKNTTGAGDAFNAGFISGMLQGRTVPEAVTLGNAVASYKVGGNSARHTPTQEQLQTFLTTTRRAR